MCKIFVMPGITDETVEIAQKLVFEMSEQMSSGADKDGLGYVAMDKNGDLFGERWVRNKDAFVNRALLDTDTQVDLTAYKSMLKEKKFAQTYNYFGDPSQGFDEMRAICLHTRLSTNEKNMANTHPFISEDGKTGLIHNGVITNHLKHKKVTSTNDSETILHLYTDNGVNLDPNQIQVIADQMEGWYAVGVLSEDLDGRKILDVFKESKASLNAVFIKELDSLVFSTSMDYILSACEIVGLTVLRAFEVSDDHLVRIDPFTGEVLNLVEFKSTAYSRYSNGSEWGEGSNYYANKYRNKSANIPSSTTHGHVSNLPVTTPGSTTQPEKKGIIIISDLKKSLEDKKKGDKFEKIIASLEKSTQWTKDEDPQLGTCYRRKDA